MKAIVLAAGKGRRLKDVVDDIPKPMIKINNVPILEYNIKWLVSYGVKEIHINTHHLSDVIIDYFQNGSKWNVCITYSKEHELLGTSGGVREIAEHWTEPFMVVYGDNLYPLGYNLSDFIDYHHEQQGVATIGLYEKEVCKSGVVLLDENNRIVEFIEKPSIVNAGIYVLDNKVIDYIPEGFSDFGRDIFPILVKEKVVNGFLFREPLIAIDTPELLRRACK